MLTGQLIFRDTTKPARVPGYKIMMVCGVISVPNNWRGKGEHQYCVTDRGVLLECIDRGDLEDIHLHFDTGVDLTTKIVGMTLDGLITSPLWKV